MIADANDSTLPESYFVGDSLDWESQSTPVYVTVELPFWLMSSDVDLTVDVAGCSFDIEVRSGMIQLEVGEITDSKNSCVYIGPESAEIRLDPELDRVITERGLARMQRKCKTVLRIRSSCSSDVLAAVDEGGRRADEGNLYLRAFCGAHIEVVNRVIQSYRLATYDVFAFEVTPWHVPIWFIESHTTHIRVALLNYAEWDRKPLLIDHEGTPSFVRFIDRPEFAEAMSIAASPGEFELLDAINLVERGDYSGAVRRITTALEVALEAPLRLELMKLHPPAEVETKLRASRTDFPGRLRQYQKLSGRKLDATLAAEIDRTRNLRHEIVHGGLRISFADRGEAHRSVDTGRWSFNWLENQPERAAVREQRLALRSIGRHLATSLFYGEITPEGVTVRNPA